MIKAYAKSDIGKVRDINQDSFYITEDQFSNINLYLLADGMGRMQCRRYCEQTCNIM